jgi:glycosyltransferase involved in cell wall biosynthesis
MRKMFTSAPKVSVVIPTHNRAIQLENSLAALCQQTYARHDFEVLVVADGCTDRTPEIARSFESRLQVRLIQQDAQGPAASRNRGAAEARGELLVFMDDDIEARPTFLAAHHSAHREDPRKVVIGYLPPLLKEQKGYLKAELRRWWETIFDQMSEPGHRFQYSDLVSGNFSLRKDFLQHAGGFDPAYRCHEDFELGIRLLRAGATFDFILQAAGYHHEGSDLQRVLKRKFEEGIADVNIGQGYPELRTTLLMARLQQYSRLPSRVLKLLAYIWPAASDRMARYFEKWLTRFEKLRWYTMWQRVLYGLMGYWYWRGVSEELPTLKAVRDFLSEESHKGQPHLALEIDLADGIAAAEAFLDAHRPEEVIICLKQVLVGRVPPQPGAERLRGAHLRSILVRNLQVPLLKALAEDLDFAHPEASDRLSHLCGQFLKRHRTQEAA